MLKIRKSLSDNASTVVNQLANESRGAVFVASQRGLDECLKLLIEHGANVTFTISFLLLFHKS